MTYELRAYVPTFISAGIKGSQREPSGYLTRPSLFRTRFCLLIGSKQMRRRQPSLQWISVSAIGSHHPASLYPGRNGQLLKPHRHHLESSRQGRPLIYGPKPVASCPGIFRQQGNGECHQGAIIGRETSAFRGSQGVCSVLRVHVFAGSRCCAAGTTRKISRSSHCLSVVGRKMVTCRCCSLYLQSLAERALRSGHRTERKGCAHRIPWHHDGVALMVRAFVGRNRNDLH
jgi:hypothetical protein